MPGEFQSWSLLFNDGAFYSDLNMVQPIEVNGWEVIETTVPLSAFDFGTLPSVLYPDVA